MRIFILLLLAIFTINCGGSETAPNTANTKLANAAVNTANAATTNADNPLNTTKTPEAATTNTAPTLAPVAQNYYEALKKKDDAALRKIYSRETLKSLEADMKEAKKKSLVEFIVELEPVPDQPFTIRNEQIQGYAATAEMRGGSYPNGIRIKFVKENGEWKMTNESPEIQSVKQSTANSNAAK